MPRPPLVPMGVFQMGLDPLSVCPRAWPLSLECSHLVSFAILASLSIVNSIALCLPQASSPSYSRFGSVTRRSQIPLRFFLAVLCSSLLVAESLAYLLYVFYIHQYTHLLLVYCLTRILFWLLLCALIVRSRSSTKLPVPVVVSLVIAALLQCAPFTAWTSFFPTTAYSNGEFVFFVVDTSLVFSTFLMAFAMKGNYEFERIQIEGGSTWSNFSRKVSLIMPYVWPRKSVGLQLRVAFCLFLLIFGRLINVALPLYNKWIVDGLAHPETFAYSLIFISSALKFLQGNGAMGGFLNTVRTYMWVPIQQYTTREIEVELFEHLHSLSLRWHLSRKTGLVLRVMDRGTNSINQILSYVLFNIVPTVLDIAIAVVFFFSTFEWKFGVLVLVTMVLYMAMTIFITEWRTQYRREMNEKENEYSAIGTDSLLNYETVKYYGNEQYEVNRFRLAILAYQAAEWKTNASLAVLNFLQNSVIGVGMTVGSMLVAYLIKTGAPLTVGDYVLFTTYMMQLYTPLNFFGTVYRVIQKAFIDMENMFELMGEEVEVRDKPNALEYRPSEGAISVRDLVFEYNAGKKVLEGISFDVRSGETIAFVGPSGAGKSTIVRLLFRLFEGVDGTIHYDGHDVCDLQMASLRRQIGIVPQDTVLFNQTIRYNIRFGRPDASDGEVEEAARAAMIHDKILSLPNGESPPPRPLTGGSAGYDTVVGERGLKLSGGEKQRVAIARTILKQPQFIFLDEATSALDTHTERAIQKCLETLCASRTTVVVAHRLSTIATASQILVLDKGHIVERGRHQELLDAKGVYARMWASQMAERGEEEGTPSPAESTSE